MTGLVLPDAVADSAGFVLAVAEIREARAKSAIPGPWCPTWTHDAIRHVQRNVDIDCSAHDDDGGAVSEDCRRFGRYDGEHIAAEANPAHALAEVALWRTIVSRHVLVTDPGTDSWCRMCVVPEYPCADLLAVVAAARAYLGETT